MMSGTLTHSPADILRRLLISLSHGTLPTASGSWPIFVSSEPNLPDQVITIYDTAGRYQGRLMRSGEKGEFHGVQIRVRGINHTDAATKANEIAVALDQDINWNQISVAGSTYMIYDVSRTSGPLSLGNEQGTNRVLFTINAVVVLRQTS